MEVPQIAETGNENADIGRKILIVAGICLAKVIYWYLLQKAYDDGIDISNL